MPRQRLNTKTAEQASVPGPKRKGGERTSEAEMMTRRRLIRGLMLVASTPDQCLAAMQSKFAGITMAEVKRLYVEAEQELLSRAGDKLDMKRARQEARVLSEIASAQGKGAHGAVASLERVYADVAGTNAPVRVFHEVSFGERFNTAFQRAAAQLTKQQADGLLNGHTVPLGVSGGGSDIITTGEESK